MSTLSLALHCPNMVCPADVPAWPYVLCGICLFSYSVLDNMDGKQARRTGSSSPLGLLFDHGTWVWVCGCVDWWMDVWMGVRVTWEGVHSRRGLVPLLPRAAESLPRNTRS